MDKELISHESIEEKIFIVRGQRVMIDRDLAGLYGVSTKALNQAVRRNLERFPVEFMFRLSEREKEEVVTNCDHLMAVKFSKVTPCAFTEHGVAMLATVINSERAVKLSILIIKTFVKLRQTLAIHKDLSLKLNEIERKVDKHDEEITAILDAIRQLMTLPASPKRRIGFLADREEKRT